MRRMFVAIELPEAVRSRLRVLQFLLPLPQRVEPEALHLTLAFLGHVSEPVLEAVHEALADLALPGFGLELRGVGFYGGARPRLCFAGVAPCGALARLQRKVAVAARRAGADVEARRFEPHVTLGRFGPGWVDLLALERAVLAQAGFHAGPFAVEGFGLWESRAGARGPRYEVLARYPLI